MTTTTSPRMTATEALSVLKMLHKGRDPGFTAQALMLDEDAVREVAENNGWPDHDRLGYAVAEAQRSVIEADRASMSNGHRPTVVTSHVTRRPPAPTPTIPRPHVPVVDSPTGLLARADKIDDGPGATAVRRAAKKARAAILALEQALSGVEEQRRRAAEDAAAKAQARDKVARLERELAAAKAALRGRPTPTTPRQPQPPESQPATKRSTGDRTAQGAAAKARHAHVREVLDKHHTTTAALRLWANENGHPCPAVGILPTAVVDAYDAAHTSTRRTA